MKLILCTNCSDVFKLSSKKVRTCSCGKCAGKYIDNLNAWYKGDYAVPLGIDNRDLFTAVINQPKQGKGEEFNSFVISEQCNTFENKT